MTADDDRPQTTGMEEEPLAGDASARRYVRIRRPSGGTVVECRYPPGAETVLERDVAVRRWAAAQGVRVPRIVAVDLRELRVLLEDLGDDDAAVRLHRTSPGRRGELMIGLLHPIAALTAIDPSSLPRWNPPLDGSLLRTELEGFERHYLDRRRGVVGGPGVGRWLDRLAERVADHPVVVCHRDYHVNNVWPSAPDPPRVIDEQDVRLGPDSYDVVSLLYERDAATLLSEDDRPRVLEAWATATNAAAGWRRRAVETRLQRGLKVLGTFARLEASRPGRYRDWLQILERSLPAVLAEHDAPPELVRTLVD